MDGWVDRDKSFCKCLNDTGWQYVEKLCDYSRVLRHKSQISMLASFWTLSGLTKAFS